MDALEIVTVTISLAAFVVAVAALVITLAKSRRG